MRFCILTSFFGCYSFGGDAVHADRLCRALLRRGHEVHAAFASRAYLALPGRPPLRSYQRPPGLILHDLTEGMAGTLSAYWAHQTGRSLWTGRSLDRLLGRIRFDVIHVHNVSLLGALGVCSRLRTSGALKLVTMHDYWWVCPLSLLWKDRSEVCREPSCFPCSLRASRPPQLWRRGQWFNQALANMDAVLFPSRSALEIYRSRGLRHNRQFVLPGILPEDWRDAAGGAEPDGRPYFAAAGRLVPEKGFQTVIPLMSDLPEVELRIAGAGPMERWLRRAAHGLPNVKFLGLLDHQSIRRLFAGARAVLVPSLFPETFGLAAAEALSLGVPVIARNLGSLPEVVGAAPGGILYDTKEQLLKHMRTLAYEDGARAKTAAAIRSSLPSVWFEQEHTRTYLEILAACGSSRQTRRPE